MQESLSRSETFTSRDVICRLMELLKSNYSAAPPEIDATEASAQWDTETYPAQSIESATIVSNSAAVRQDDAVSTAPRRFDDMESTLYIHQSSLLGLHRLLGHYVRPPSLGSWDATDQNHRLIRE
jgi:hypothetical protein